MEPSRIERSLSRCLLKGMLRSSESRMEAEDRPSSSLYW